MSNTKDNANDIDASSFASILAGVQKMREDAGSIPSQDPTLAEVNNDTQPNASSLNAIQPLAPVPAPPPQTHTNVTNEKYQKATLNESTAKPIPPKRNNNSVKPSTKRTQTSGPSDILVSRSQEGNPLLSTPIMQATPWSFDKSLLSDYYINPKFQIIFLTLKYHKLHPEHIWNRWKKLNQGSSTVHTRGDDALRVLLVVVDVDSHQDLLRKLLDFCIKHDLSLVLAWSYEEAANYIALCKQLDKAPLKGRKIIEGTKGSDYNSSVVKAFTGIKLVNKTDVSNLLANCKSVKEIVLQSCQNDNDDGIGLASIPGLGAKKLENLKKVFLEPFISNKDYDT